MRWILASGCQGVAWLVGIEICRVPAVLTCPTNPFLMYLQVREAAFFLERMAANVQVGRRPLFNAGLDQTRSFGISGTTYRGLIYELHEIPLQSSTRVR